MWRLVVENPNKWCYRLTHDISPDYCPDDNEDFTNDFISQTPPYSPAFLTSQSALTARTTTSGVQKGQNNITKDVNQFFTEVEDNNNVEDENFPREALGRQPDIIETHVCRPNNKLLNSQTNYYNYKNDQMVDYQNSNHVQEIIDTSVSQPTTGTSPPIRTRLGLNGFRNVRRPRKLPEIPKKYIKAPSPDHPLPLEDHCNEKSLAEELEEAVLGVSEIEDNTEDEHCESHDETEDIIPSVISQASDHVPPLFKAMPRARSRRKSHRVRMPECLSYSESKLHRHYNEVEYSQDNQHNTPVLKHKVCHQTAGSSGRKDSGEDESKNQSSCGGIHAVYLDLEVTHRGMHRFIPRHSDEMDIEIGDPIHVNKEEDDLWCEGVNLRSGKTGVFPSMYATNLDFLEEEEEDENEQVKFTIRFLGSVEVRQHKGDDVLRQAISKVVMTRRKTMVSNCPPMCTLEVSDYGILMLDKSKEGHESDNLFTHFFSLKNISYCGHHPKNDRYFAFITKHPNAYKYACHVFLGERTTRNVSDAVGRAFKRFYQEYMAFTHPTEDIYME